MLLQSHDGFIRFLPALPDSWSEGQFRGLVARGGLVINLSWKDNKVQEVTMRATKTNTVLVMDPFEGEIETWRQGDRGTGRPGERERTILIEGMLELTMLEGEVIVMKRKK
jgi:hypothetical protein